MKTIIVKRYKPLLWLAMLFLLLSARPLSAGELSRPIQAEGAILLELNSGEILFEQNAGRRLYPASTTKIMTALLLIENSSLEDTVTAGDEIYLIGKDSSSAGLEVGDQISVEELIWAMLLPSGNDAAYTAAVHCARVVEGAPQLLVETALARFAELMNKKARDLGAFDTRFVTPDGYHHPGHYSTARDLALIAREALQHDLFREVVRSPSHNALYHNRDGVRVTQTWYNTNLLLHEHRPEFYPRATGLKTGYTPEAGYNLIAAANGGTVSLVAVILNSAAEARWEDAASLLDYGLDNFSYHPVVSAGDTVAVAGIANQAPGEILEMPLIAAEGYSGLFEIEELSAIESEIHWTSRKVREATGERPVLKAPLKEGQVMGTVTYTLNGTPFFETSILAGTDVKARFPWGYLLWAALVLIVLLLLRRRRRLRKARYRSGRKF